MRACPSLKGLPTYLFASPALTTLCDNSVVPTALGDLVPLFPALKRRAITSRPLRGLSSAIFDPLPQRNEFSHSLLRAGLLHFVASRLVLGDLVSLRRRILRSGIIRRWRRWNAPRPSHHYPTLNLGNPKMSGEVQ